MAGVKISNLPAVASAQLTDVFPEVQTGVTYKVTNTQLLTLFKANGEALTKTDDTNVTVTLAGSPTTALLNATSLTMGWAGLLAPSRGGTGISSLGAGVATWLGTPSSANLATAVTDETGSGSLTFATSPTLVTPRIAQINDTNGNAIWTMNPNPAAVNNWAINNTISGNPTQLAPIGTDTNIGAQFLTKGTGQFIFSSAHATVPIIWTTGTTYQHFTNWSIPDTAATRTITLQDASGTMAYLTDIHDTWVDQTTTPVTMATRTGYTSDAGASLITFTLPSSSEIGDWIEINGKGSGGWIIAQAAGQQIHVGNVASTLGAGGSVASTNQFDGIRLRCLTANTIWAVISSQSAGFTIV